MKKLLFVLLFLSSIALYSQSDSKDNSELKKFRIGLKIGTPNTLSGNIEYVSPLLKNRVAAFFDYSGYSLYIDDSNNKFNYVEAGINIYLRTDGKGFYASLSYGKLDVKSYYEDALTFDKIAFEGEAEGKLDVNTFNTKIGYLIGNKFYFRTEIGYGFGKIPQEVIIHGNINQLPVQGTKEIPDIPGISENGYPLFNIGFGFSF